MTGVNERKYERRGGAGNRGNTGRQRENTVDFVNYELSAEETAVYRKWRDDVAGLIGHLDRMAQDGYKVSIKYDDYSESFACFVFADDAGDNAGKCLTGRGGTTYRALAEALFKHVEIFGGDWSDTGRIIRPSDDPDW